MTDEIIENETETDDLESLLSEFEQSLGNEQEELPEQKTEQINDESTEEQSELQREYNFMSEHIAREHEEREIDIAVNLGLERIREVDPTMTAETMKTFLIGKYYSDPSFASAWDNRGQYSDVAEQAIKKAVDSRVKEIEEIRASQPDEAMTETRNAIASAVMAASSSGNVPDDAPINLNNLTDREFEDLKRRAISN